MLAAGVLFRVTVLPLTTGFSDDLYRYRWEGSLQAAGGNPYLVSPNHPSATGLCDRLYPKVDGKDFRAVYGPLLELEERAVYRLASSLTAEPLAQLFVFKVIAGLADLATIGVLMLLLRARGLPVERVLIYAWCPLPIFEFWGTGHNDAFVVLLIALALHAAARERQSSAYLWLALAAAAKIWPLILFPALTGWKPRRMLTAGACLATVALATSLPFGMAVLSNRDFTSGFLGGWRNNDSLFGVILALSGDPYRAKYIAFALTAVAALVISATHLTLERKMLATVAAMLLVSSNVHPWYASWLLPMLVLEPVPAGLLFLCLVPVFYEAVIGWALLREWNGLSWLRWPVYGGVAVAGVVSVWVQKKLLLIKNHIDVTK